MFSLFWFSRKWEPIWIKPLDSPGNQAAGYAMPIVCLRNAQQPVFSVNFARAHSLATRGWQQVIQVLRSKTNAE